jgi:capsular polysaccharide export protein
MPGPVLRIPLWSHGLWRMRFLGRLLGRRVRVALLPLRAKEACCWVGWGAKPSARRAAWYAARTGEPCLRIEDGFLRSCGLGVHGAPPLSVVSDDIGIYYDATRPSRLESLIAALEANEGLQAQARHALGLVRRHRLSKYNHAPELRLPQLAPGRTSRVLVVDQTLGDLSVRLGGADQAAFASMLSAALDENQDAEVWVKAHPDALTGKKQGYLDAARLAHHPDPRLQLLAEDVSPLALLEQVDKVYVVTSQMGFEALMLDKPVVCFGLPWYAGWGLTQDRHPGVAALASRRNVRRTVEQLFEAAYLHYAHYLDPASGKPGTIFDVIDWLARNKAANDAARGDIYCVGMSLWKRAIVRPFLQGPSCRVRFVGSVAALRRRRLPADSKIVTWGVRHETQARALAAERQLPLWRMEDGFLRSVGLGSDLFRPVSLVLDRSGMYYDPASGSELERILSTQELDAAELSRAARLREAFVSLRVSKYNLGRRPLSVNARGRKVLLVPGQVEDDASVALGSPAVSTNLALLLAVRAANPDACILYKAHPDVVAGNRRGAIPEEQARALADQCVNDANIIDCILAADEVHTMTSLSGFEALLHRRVVHCYGGPFYAGWGLTVDHFPLPQRQRQVSVDALVHAVMLAYPRYVLPGVHGFASAEQVMLHLVEQASRPAASLDGAWFGRKQRKLHALAELVAGEWAALRR